MKINKVKKEKQEKVKFKPSSNYFKSGIYSAVMIVVVIAIVIAANLLISHIPSKYTKYDISGNDLYSIGDETKTVLKSLTEDINVYVLIAQDSADSTLSEMLDRYTQESSHIKVSYIDPVTSPNFASQYGAGSLSENSLIVEGSKRYTTVSFDDIWSSTMDYNAYYSTGTYSYIDTFDGESLLTTAIDYCISDSLPVLYYTEGHDETSLESSATSMISKSNMQTSALASPFNSIPDDCDALIINAPTKDFSADEAAAVIEYLEAGGSAYITAGYTTETMTNFNSILEDYGLTVGNQLVLEGSTSGYYYSPLYIIPTMASHDITTPLISASSRSLLMNCVPLTKTDSVRSSVSITSLLTTSSSAFLKTVTNGKIDSATKGSSDPSGTYMLGAAVTETVGDKTTKLVVISTPNLVSEDLVSSLNLGNLDLFINSLSWMTEHDSTISIHSKEVTTEYLTVPAASVNLWLIVWVIAIPAACIIAGLSIWLIRRRK